VLACIWRPWGCALAPVRGAREEAPGGRDQGRGDGLQIGEGRPLQMGGVVLDLLPAGRPSFWPGFGRLLLEVGWLRGREERGGGGWSRRWEKRECREGGEWRAGAGVTLNYASSAGDFSCGASWVNLRRLLSSAWLRPFRVEVGCGHCPEEKPGLTNTHISRNLG
jgi:hypothetical protein